MEKLKLDDFTKYKFLSGLKFSPNGSKLAFILHEMDVEENKYLSNIHIYDLENKAFTKLTSSNTAKSFVFKDENTLLFPDMRDKKDKERKEKGEDFTLYYEISLRGGEASKAFEIPLIVSKLELIDEDRLLLAEYNHHKPNLEGLSQEEKQRS